jgi:hypothetical protein
MGPAGKKIAMTRAHRLILVPLQGKMSYHTTIIAAEAKLVLLGEVNNELCFMCGVPLGPGEDTVCTLHARQV